METATQFTHEERDDKRIIQMQLEHFEREQRFFSARKARLEEVMARKSTKKWKPEKVQQMVRRHNEAKNSLEAATNAVLNLTDRLSLQQEES